MPCGLIPFIAKNEVSIIVNYFVLEVDYLFVGWLLGWLVMMRHVSWTI